MSVLFEEQDEFVVEDAKDSVLPVSVFEEMVLHHESFHIEELKEVIEKIGGKVHHA